MSELRWNEILSYLSGMYIVLKNSVDKVKCSVALRWFDANFNQISKSENEIHIQ